MLTRAEGWIRVLPQGEYEFCEHCGILRASARMPEPSISSGARLRALPPKHHRERNGATRSPAPGLIWSSNWSRYKPETGFSTVLLLKAARYLPGSSVGIISLRSWTYFVSASTREEASRQEQRVAQIVHRFATGKRMSIMR